MFGQILFPGATEEGGKLLCLVRGSETLFSPPFTPGWSIRYFPSCPLCRLASTPPYLWTTVLELPSPFRTDQISWACSWARNILCSSAEGRNWLRALQCKFDWRNLHFDSWRLLPVTWHLFRQAKSLSFHRYFSLLSEAAAFEGPHQFVHH